MNTGSYNNLHTAGSTDHQATATKFVWDEMFCKSLKKKKKKKKKNIQDDSVHCLIRKHLHSLFCCICFVFKKICVSLASQAQNSPMR